MDDYSEHVVHTCASECGFLFLKTNQKINIFPLDARVSEHTIAALSMQNSAEATRGTAMPLTCVHSHDGGKRSLGGGPVPDSFTDGLKLQKVEESWAVSPLVELS